ncbi:hypothetical protein HPB50_023022 [Hyalomma asiaticum]|uniref:Uncharacterized protein n=1 Tax=Hyalomma asiaticum TaxID=266040 RepID=A0ACB7SJW4_HYAAI|nr:hypothetical protein HPB50_023022 [Hyalomma asiaticum]
MDCATMCGDSSTNKRRVCYHDQLHEDRRLCSRLTPFQISKEMQKCIQEFKEELRNEFKNLRESLERSIRLEERNHVEEMKRSTSFVSNGLDEANKRLEASLTENKLLKKENEALRLQVVAIERDLATCQADLVKEINSGSWLRNSAVGRRKMAGGRGTHRAGDRKCELPAPPGSPAK